MAYLEQYGWTVDPEPAAVEELLIPETFDETYAQYLDLQASQGFDLTKYCGKRVKRYAYTITNYPTGETGVQAGLLVYKNTVIGGEVLSSQLDGFIHGLARPSPEQAGPPAAPCALNARRSSLFLSGPSVPPGSGRETP